MRVSKALYLNRERGIHLDVIAQATDILNHTNFSVVSNTFPNTAAFPTDPITGQQVGLTTSAVVPTPEGTVNLLDGPYKYRGFVPKSASELSSPLAFTAANPPRQLSLALQFAF